MGVDLCLLRVEGLHFDFAFAADMLTLVRRSPLWEPLQEVARKYGTRVPRHFSTHWSQEPDPESDPHYGQTSTDSYGEPILMVETRYLLPFADHPCVLDDPVNVAAWAWMAALPLDTLIALYWT